MASVELDGRVIEAIITSHQNTKTYSLRELASRAGLSPSLLSAIKNGTRCYVKIGTADALAEGLGVPPEFILRGSHE